jgi:hypothetical protein
MKKTIAKKTASVSHVVLAQAAQAQPAGVTDPVPTAVAPSPPQGYVATRLGRGALSVMRSQVALAAKAAGEITSCTTYASLGAAAPDQASVASALTTAAAWSGVAQNASNWYAYVKQQEAAAWKHATGLTDTLQVPFEYQLARDATLEKQFPSLTSYYAAPKARATKAVATKKKKAAEKKAGTSTAAPAAAPSPSAASAVAAPAPAVEAKALN